MRLLLALALIVLLVPAEVGAIIPQRTEDTLTNTFVLYAKNKDTTASPIQEMAGTSSCEYSAVILGADTVRLVPRPNLTSSHATNVGGATTISSSGSGTFTPGQPYFSFDWTSGLNDGSSIEISCSSSSGGSGVADRQAATDCTAETGGTTAEVCQELDDNQFYVCESGTCNASGWVLYGGGAADNLGNQTGDGTNPLTGVTGLFVDEGAAAAADVLGDGQFWVLNEDPNIAMFTSDDGVDHYLSGDKRFYAENYADGSATGGIREAYAACVAAHGGQVWLPRGAVQFSASGLTSPVLNMDGIDIGNGTKSGACTLHGYGSGYVNNNSISPYERGGSEIRVTDMDLMTADGNGLRSVIEIGANGSLAQGFSVRMMGTLTTDMIGINIQVAQTSVLRDVTVRDTAAVETGTGIRVMGSQKSMMENVRVDDMGRGVWFDNFGATSNSYTIIASTFRSGHTGIYIEGDATASSTSCAAAINVFGGTIEGNWYGLDFESDAQCSVNLYGTHFENEQCEDIAPDDGTCDIDLTTLEADTGWNIRANAAQAGVHMFGGQLQGGAQYDFERTVAQAFSSGGGGNEFTGPDLFVGVETFHDWNVTAGTVIGQNLIVRRDDITLTGVTIQDGTAQNIVYDPTTSGASSTTDQDALDELFAEKLDASEVKSYLIAGVGPVNNIRHPGDVDEDGTLGEASDRVACSLGDRFLGNTNVEFYCVVAGDSSTAIWRATSEQLLDRAIHFESEATMANASHGASTCADIHNVETTLSNLSCADSQGRANVLIPTDGIITEIAAINVSNINQANQGCSIAGTVDGGTTFFGDIHLPPSNATQISGGFQKVRTNIAVSAGDRFGLSVRNGNFAPSGTPACNATNTIWALVSVKYAPGN